MAQSDAQTRLERLLVFLEQDPDNAPLLRDAAEAALDAGEPQRAKMLFARLKDVGELTDADGNLWAIAAMRGGEPEMAAQTFESLLLQQPGDHALIFNLAWARALAGDLAGARKALTTDTAKALPQAALLDVQLMHQSGEFEAAAERAKEHLQRHGDYPPLLAAVSTLAMDVEDEGLARTCAEKAGDHPEALVTLAALALGKHESEHAKALFEQSLAADARSPRAWVGLGLAELAQGNGAAAAEHIDKGAEMFDDHLGSWIAAGWAWLIAGDRTRARARFEHAVALDANFAESQGSLAVIEVLDGQGDAARQRVEIATRLDRQCFAAAFAQVLLSSSTGDTDTVERIMETALKQPIDAQGRTIGDAIARLAR